MKRKIKYLTHFHKPFISPRKSNWVIPTIYENSPNIVKDALILSKYRPCIRSLFKDFEPLSDERIGYLSQTIAAEYWILNHLNDADYVGVSGYRRYPLINYDRSNPSTYISTPATKDILYSLTNNSNLELINSILDTYEVITVSKTLIGGTVKTQFLLDQRLDIWENFIDSICKIAPEYKPWINWFDLENQVQFCGPMGLTPLPMFKEYADMYSRIVSNMLLNIENPFSCYDERARSRTDRWIGYMAERFYPFFLFVNNVKIYQVPMVFLSDEETPQQRGFWKNIFNID